MKKGVREQTHTQREGETGGCRREDRGGRIERGKERKEGRLTMIMEEM